MYSITIKTDNFALVAALKNLFAGMLTNATVDETDAILDNLARIRKVEKAMNNEAKENVSNV